jgi:hypothetical protein
MRARAVGGDLAVYKRSHTEKQSNRCALDESIKRGLSLFYNLNARGFRFIECETFVVRGSNAVTDLTVNAHTANIGQEHLSFARYNCISH